MSVADFGDSEDLAEMSQLEAPLWDGIESNVELVFVCSPLHVVRARKFLPKARIALVSHQGFGHKVPYSEDAAVLVTFSTAVQQFIQSDATRLLHLRDISRYAVLTPHFRVTPNWRWRSNVIWTMKSRPDTREPLALAMLNSIQAMSKLSIRVFGQLQSDGLLDRMGKEKLRSESSCYLSALHPRAGFGLSEHEAMAAGCPVIGTLWGDLQLSHRLGLTGPWSGFREYGDLYNLIDLLSIVATTPDRARQISEEQQEYVSSAFSVRRMDASITELLDLSLLPASGPVNLSR